MGPNNSKNDKETNRKQKLSKEKLDEIGKYIPLKDKF